MRYWTKLQYGWSVFICTCTCLADLDLCAWNDVTCAGIIAFVVLSRLTVFTLVRITAFCALRTNDAPGIRRIRGAPCARNNGTIPVPHKLTTIQVFYVLRVLPILTRDMLNDTRTSQHYCVEHFYDEKQHTWWIYIVYCTFDSVDMNN